MTANQFRVSPTAAGTGASPPARRPPRSTPTGAARPQPARAAGVLRHEAADQLIILGIDPGSLVTGYGVVGARGMELSLLAFGALKLRDGVVAARLVELYDRLKALVEEWQPAEVAIEEPFSRVNARSAFVLGKAQAAAILAVSHAGLPVFEYTPAAVKQAVTSYGRSGKEQVQEMVRLQFGLATVPRPADAADAVAVALCHLAHRRTNAMIEASRHGSR